MWGNGWSGEVLGKDVQGGGGVAIPGGFQEKDGCHAEWHGLEWSKAWVNVWA